MHAYQVMAELGRLFGPAYRPSPGTVYPAIDALHAEGLISAADDGSRTVYALAEAGRDALEQRPDMLAEIERRTGVRLRSDDSLEPVLARFRARVAPLSGRVDADAVAAVLDRAAGEIESLDGHPTKEE